MGSIVLIFANQLPGTQEVLSALRGFEEVQVQQGDGEIHVGNKGEHLWLLWENAGHKDDGTIIQLAHSLPLGGLPANPCLLSVEYNGHRIVMDVARRLAAHFEFLVHTGSPEDYCSTAFAARYDAEPEWQFDDTVAWTDEFRITLYLNWPPAFDPGG